MPTDAGPPTTAQLNPYTSFEFEDQGVDEQPRTDTEARRALLTALRNVIIPLVQTALSKSKVGGLDSNDLMGHESEAEGLLSALHTYISTVIRDGTKTRVVNLKEISERADRLEAGPGHGKVTVEKKKRPNPLLLRRPEIVGAGWNIEKFTTKAEEMVIFRTVSGRDGEKVLLKNLLTSLREHVFNNLPIRLLCFRKSDLDESKLEISLLDRGEVYSYLEHKFRSCLMTRHEENPAAYVMTDTNHPISGSMSKYVVLSHTWLRSAPEVTYDEWRNGSGKLDLWAHEGYRKLVNFCRVAEADYGISLGWMDTVCIDKSSSSELDESIRSMYEWYEKAAICITHLADTSSLSDMANDRWFTRGWTLQELIAPERLNFYGRDWKRLSGTESESGSTLHSYSDKNLDYIQKIIHNATGITPRHIIYPASASISVKMQWAAKRQVTRSEDAAYALMGLFRVSMSIAYGEGPTRAFRRLVREILNTTRSYNILDIFDFGGGHVRSRQLISRNLLPLTPEAYLDRSDFDFSRGALIEPLLMTHLGLRIPVLLLKAAPGLLPLSERYMPIGDYFADPVSYVPIDEAHDNGEKIDFWSSSPAYLNILDVSSKQNPLRRNGLPVGFLQVIVLNCTAAPDDADICVPTKCIAAVYVHYNLNQGKSHIKATTKMSKMQTKSPVTFALKSSSAPHVGGFYKIPRSKLARHGMQFLTMYL